jgi:uncharacterized protein (DUF1919 family)
MQNLKEEIRGIQKQLRLKFVTRKKAEKLHAMDAKKNIIIFCSDCTGGLILEDYSLPVYTPTVNVGFYGEDFLKFCENPDKYVNEEVEWVPELDENCPWTDSFEVKCADITMFFSHVDSFEEGKKGWNRRCKLYRKAIKKPHEIVVVMNDRNMFCEDMLPRFQQLPYKYKVIFTHKNYNMENAFYMVNEDEKEFVDTMTLYEHHNFSLKRRYDRFDFFKWFEEIYNS